MTILRNHTKGTRVLALSMVATLLTADVASAAQPDALLAWGRRDEGEYNIYISQQQRGSWSEPKKLSGSPNPEILPAVGADAQGDTWVVWTELLGGHSRLHFRHQLGGTWYADKHLNTNTTSDIAPALLMAPDGLPWLAWAGFDGEDDDIYYTRWLGDNWAEPERVNLDDDVPDILPSLSLDDQDAISISWFGFDGHEYIEFRSKYLEGNWTQERPTGRTLIEESEGTGADSSRSVSGTTLPPFLHDRSQAALFQPGSDHASRRLGGPGRKF